MQIPDEALDEFIKIYKDEFGPEVNRVEAVEMVNRLLMLFEALAQPLPGEQISTTS